MRWITDSLFDFCELPFSVKRPLPEGVAISVEEKVKSKMTNQLSGMCLPYMVVGYLNHVIGQTMYPSFRYSGSIG